MKFESIKNKTVILRCDFNEPTEKNILSSSKRIDASLLSIQELLSRNNKVILISHHSDRTQTLLPVYNYLTKIFKNKIEFISSLDQDFIKKYFKDISKDKNSSQIFLLENTRMFGIKTNKQTKSEDELSDKKLTSFFASLGECFIFDAFSVAHRDHASTTGIAKSLPSCFGPVFLKEYLSLNKIIKDKSKTVAFIGGAKLSTKLTLIEKLSRQNTLVIIGGAMIHPVLKKLGQDIKQSFIDKDCLENNGKDLDNILNKVKNKQILLPSNLIWDKKGSAQREEKIKDNEFDFTEIKQEIEKRRVKNILWNGPVGVFEEKYKAGSKQIYKFLKEKKESDNIFTVCGGGDTITFLETINKNFEKDFSYVSLSGGAMLEFLSEETLPILKIIK